MSPPRHAPVLLHFLQLLQPFDFLPSGAAIAPALAEGAQAQALAQLEAWALAEPALGFGPTSPVNPQGHTLAQALVCGGACPDADWLRGWVARHGVEALYPPGAQGPDHPLVAVMARVMDPSARQPALSPQRTALLEALVDLAPSCPVPQDTVVAWMERLCLAGEEDPGKDQEQARLRVARAMEAWAGNAYDPARPAVRWVRRLGCGAHLDTNWLERGVLGPSGMVRSLGAFLDTQRMASATATGGGDWRIADLPCPEEAVAWIMEADLQAEQARRRAWSCALSSPAGFSRVLEALETGVLEGAGKARLRTVLALRDAQGRSLAALLATRKPAQDAGAGPTLLEHAMRAGVCRQEDLPSLAGEGLLSQLMADPTWWPGDIHPGIRPTDWLDGKTGSMINDLIDATVHGRSGPARATGRAVGALLETAGHADAARLGQALAWGDFHGAVAKWHGSADSGRSMLIQAMAMAASDLADHLEAHGPLLDIGRAEWRQWQRLPGWRLARNQGSGAIARSMERLERAVEARELARALNGLPGELAPARAAARL